MAKWEVVRCDARCVASLEGLKTIHRVTCDPCQGRGGHYDKQGDRIDCRKCGGKGTVRCGKCHGSGRIVRPKQSEAVAGPRSIRERFQPPWRVEDVPGGYRVTDTNGRPLAYVYAVDVGARAALPEALTPAEAHAIATAIARLPDMLPAP
jgi:hypothetical protein